MKVKEYRLVLFDQCALELCFQLINLAICME
jgi:hypothetical protein